MSTVHDFTFTLLEHNETGALLLVLTLPDGRRVCKDVASEDDARAEIQRTTAMLQAFYKANGIEGDWVDGGETRPAEPSKAYMN